MALPVAIGAAISAASRVGTAITAVKAAKAGISKLTSKKVVKSTAKAAPSKKGAIGKAVKGLAIAGGVAGGLYLAEKAAEKLGVRGGAGFIGARPGSGKRFRRIDPLNIKALRRSTRRLAGFDKVADSVRKELSKLAPRPKARSSPGSISAAEAIKALRN